MTPFALTESLEQRTTAIGENWTGRCSGMPGGMTGIFPLLTREKGDGRVELTPMQYKSYVWPHNPRTYTIQYVRKVAVHKVPFGLYHLQDLGRTGG